MNTEIEYLKQLETDLKDAAARETTRMERATLQGAIRKNTGRGWTKVVGVAAAFLVVAGAIGFLAQGGLMISADSGGQAAFEVGGAAADGGGGNSSASQAPGVGYAAPGPTDEEGAIAPPTISGVNKDALDTARGRVGGQQQDLSKIVRDGRIGVVVPDDKFGDAVGNLTFIAEKYGGFILSSSTNNDRSGTFVLRVPAKRFDRALGDIRDLATRVRFQEIRGDDVTAEYIDQHARLRILQGRKILLSSLSQQATTTEEILRLGSQLDDVQLRIEQIQGQLRFINDQVAESTLRVSIQEQNAPKASTQTDVDNPNLGSSVDLGVQGFLRIVGAVIVGLGYLIPLTLLGALVWFVVWLVRRRRAIA
jgi:hypothetical protein